MLLNEHVAIVTGAGRGIGKAIALALAQEGATVGLAARTLEQIESTASTIRASGGQALAIPTDVSNVADVEQLVSECLTRFGKIDILVNNAAIIRRSAVLEMPIEEWDRVINTNLRGVFLCCKAVLRPMLECKKGHIVNITSERAKQGVANRSAYCASKAAIVAFSQSLHAEVKNNGISVHTVYPAGVNTGMIRASHPDISPSRWIAPGYVGKAVVFLVSQPPPVDIPELTIRSMAD